ncbi:DsbA family oxidoreductase [Mucilaginibacter gynuensis]|uniref:DsbA family oxidoreductase n=1 Tax=Mucilaginibacter gynuensis TaxID=1302236 RepID=A0ABP8GFK1_9SPHI
MKIEIWSDIACPYCFIGFKHLEYALKQFKGDRPDLILRSFELEPDIAINSGETQHAAVMRKYHQSSVRAQQTLDGAMNAGKLAGLSIDFDKVITTNTFHAHRLIHFASTLGKELEMKERLFTAYFIEGKHIGDKYVLAQIATDMGIHAGAILNSELFSAEVRSDEHQSHQLGIRSVPFFLFDGKFAVSGAQPVETFLEVLNRLQAVKELKLHEPGNNEAGCEGGSCTV